MVASLPVRLGFVPTESLVVMCCHEPRGRAGLTLRLDLPPERHETICAEEIERRVRHERATRVVLAVYTDEKDGSTRPRVALVEDLCERFDDLVVTEALLVREGRFWSYLCDLPQCCPPDGTAVDAAAEAAPLMLLKAETVLEGRSTFPDRAALEASLAGPVARSGEAARQRCKRAEGHLATLVDTEGRGITALMAVAQWTEVLERFTDPPGELSDEEAAALAVSLSDKLVRDAMATTSDEDQPGLTLLLEQLCRRTPEPYDAPVCTLLGWLLYCRGGGAVVTMMVERALRSDPGHQLAQLLDQALQAQLPPRRMREITQAAAAELP